MKKRDMGGVGGGDLFHDAHMATMYAPPRRQLLGMDAKRGQARGCTMYTKGDSRTPNIQKIPNSGAGLPRS
jgi:hypothetical protein